MGISKLDTSERLWTDTSENLMLIAQSTLNCHHGNREWKDCNDHVWSILEYDQRIDTIPSNLATTFSLNEIGAGLFKFITNMTRPSLVIRIVGFGFPDGQRFGEGMKLFVLNSLVHGSVSIDLNISLWDLPNWSATSAEEVVGLPLWNEMKYMPICFWFICL